VVSTVVNHARGNTLVSEQTRQRVMAAAEQLGYRPHYASRSLRERRSRTLGVYVPPAIWSGVGYGYDGAIIRGVDQACREAEFDLLLINMGGRQSSQVCIDKFAESRIDGLLEMNTNVAAVDYAGDLDQMHAVEFDNQRAVQIALDHLASLGHRRIGFVASCKTHVNADVFERKQKFIQYAKALGLEFDDKWIFDSQTLGRTLEPNDACCEIEGRSAAEYFLDLGDSGPTAVLAYNDLTAVNMMYALMDRGLRIPLDLSVMGIDNNDSGKRSYPSLTTIAHPLTEMGYDAARFLIHRSNSQLDADGGLPQTTYRKMFAPSLVIRKSTRSLT
jgi:LacI family transcriptional regulator